MYNNFTANKKPTFERNKNEYVAKQLQYVLSSRNQSNIERAKDLYSRDRYDQIQITEDNSVVSREVTLHKTIIPLLVITKIYGLFPLQNICDQNGSNMVFKWCSWQSGYCILKLSLPLTLLSYYIYNAKVHWKGLDYFLSDAASITFDGLIIWTTSIINHFICLQLAKNWPKFMMKWELMENETVQLRYLSNFTIKIKIVVIFFVFYANATNVPIAINYFKTVNQDTKTDEPNYSFVYFTFETITTAIDITSTIRDLFIIILSCAMAEKFRQLNQKLISVKTKNILPNTFWQESKNAYNILLTTTQDVDELLSKLILVSFTCNLLQISSCLIQLNNEKTTLGTDLYCFWMVLIVLRTITIITYTASINDQYKEIKIALHYVSNEKYEKEVVRFLTLVTTNDIALTGCQLFPVTRTVLLTFFGSFFTYVMYRFQAASKAKTKEVANVSFVDSL